METKMKRLKLNVSGTIFETTKKALVLYPNTRLGRLAEALGDSQDEELYFDRPAESFGAILAFYKTGELHLPPMVCPNVFKKELNYWEIDYKRMEYCCLTTYTQFMDNHQKKAEFKLLMDSKEIFLPVTSVRGKIWSIIEYHERTWLSKLWFLIGVLFVLISVVNLAVSTLPRFRSSLTPCQYREYMKNVGNIDEDVLAFFEKHDCKKMKPVDDGDFFSFWFDDSDDWDYYYNYDTSNETTTEYFSSTISGVTRISNTTAKVRKNIKFTLPDIELKNNVFYVIDWITLAFFTFELMLRIITCPSFKTFFRSVLNGIDVIILAGTYADLLLVNVWPSYQYETTLRNVIDGIKFLRVLRLLRYCQHLAAIQVLRFSIRHNAKDLLVLLFHIGIILLIFANIIFLVEDTSNIDSVPQGWWLGLVTITTVGYGDFSPKTVLGKVACSVCALLGIIMLSLIIPIFVGTFHSVYGLAGSNDENGRIMSNDHNYTVVRPIEKRTDCFVIDASEKRS